MNYVQVMTVKELLARLRQRQLIDADLAKELAAKYGSNTSSLIRDIMRQGIVPEEVFTVLLAKANNIPYSQPSSLRVSRSIAVAVPDGFTLKYGVMPLNIERQVLTVAMAPPLHWWAEDYLHFLFGRIVRRVMVTPSAMRFLMKAVRQWKPDPAAPDTDLLWEPDIPTGAEGEDFPFAGRRDSLQNILYPEEPPCHADDMAQLVGCCKPSAQPEPEGPRFVSSVENIAMLGNFIGEQKKAHALSEFNQNPAPQEETKRAAISASGEYAAVGITTSGLEAPVFGNMPIGQAYAVVVEGLRRGATHIAWPSGINGTVTFMVDGSEQVVPLSAVPQMPGQLLVADILRLPQ